MTVKMTEQMIENIEVLKTYQDTLEKYQKLADDNIASLDIKFLKKVDASLLFFEKFKLKDYLNDEKELHLEFKSLINKNDHDQIIPTTYSKFTIKEFMIDLENQIFLKFFKFLNILNILVIDISINFKILKDSNSSKIPSNDFAEIVLSTNTFLFFNQLFHDHFHIRHFDEILSECNLLIPLTLLVHTLEKTITNNENSFINPNEFSSKNLRTHLSIIASFHLVNPNLFKSLERAKAKMYQNKSFKNEFSKIWVKLFSKISENDKINYQSSTEGVSKNFDNIMKTGILQLISLNTSIDNDLLRIETLNMSNIVQLFEIHDFLQTLIDSDCSIADDSDDENCLVDNNNQNETKVTDITTNTSQLIKLYSYIMDDSQTMELFCLIYIITFEKDITQYNDRNRYPILSPKLEDFFRIPTDNSCTISKRFKVEDILHYLNNKIIGFQLLRNPNTSKQQIDNLSENNSKIYQIQNSDDYQLKFKILFEFLDQNNLNFKSWFPLSKLESDNSYEMNLILFLRVSLSRIFYDLSHLKETNSLDLFTENITQLHLDFHDSGCKFNLLSLFNDVIYKLCDIIMKDYLHDVSSGDGISWHSSKLLKLRLCESIAIQPKWNYIFPTYDLKVYEEHELTDRFSKYNNITNCLELCISILSILISRIHSTNEDDTPIIKQILTINIMILETSIKLNNRFLKHFSLTNMCQLIISDNLAKTSGNSDNLGKNFDNLGTLIKILNNLIEIDLNSINLSIIIYEYLIFDAKIPIKENNYCLEELRTFLTVLQVMFDPKLRFSFSSKLDNYLNGISKIEEKDFLDSDINQSTLKSNTEFRNAFLADHYDDDCESSISSAITKTNNSFEYLEEIKAEEDIRIIELNSFMKFLKLNKLENLELENYNKSKEVNFNNRTVSSFHNFTPSSNRKINLNSNSSTTNGSNSYSSQINSNATSSSTVQNINANKNFSTFLTISNSFN